MLAITSVMEQYLDPKTNSVKSEKDNEKKRSQLKVSTSSQFERKLKLLRASRVDWRRWLYIYPWSRLHKTNLTSGFKI